ncbi:MAG: ABC transporter permease subunit [Eubacteriales bacterium]|nr:ABC transporter permease subunit [Eubacteriales bacterium]
MKKRGKLRLIKKQFSLQMFVWIGIAYILLFSFVPMFGILMAFKDYDIVMGVKGIFTSEWVGLKYFKEFVSDYNFANLVKNTAGISVLKLIFTFPVPIIFAIMLSEMRSLKFKKLVQTCSYLPHFISWVIISGISFQFLSSSGIINTLLLKVGLIEKPIGFLTDASKYWGFAVASDVWKEMGWWTIVFLAAIVGVNQDLYEAAQIDGAGRLQRIWHITLPCIKPTVVVVLIMALGNLFGGGLSGSNFEQSYLMGNSMNQSASEIIATYVFKVGLAQGRYAYATAVGLIQSVISLILIFSSNFFSKKIAGTGLF